MQYETITTERQLADFCESISGSTSIAFDTEFVSEDSYEPELCLVQVTADERQTIIDPTTLDETTPFWRLLAAPGHETVVHAGREEFRFCRRFTGERPHGLFDLQVAAGLVGLEYPASYGTLNAKLLGNSLRKGETRTDWRQRPLSQRQLQYALQDVLYLQPMRDVLVEKLEKLGRTEWLAAEMADWQDKIERADSCERWRRVSGISGLSGRALAIVRQLWRWREGEAQRRNRPPRRVLRDDLIAELARRGSADIRQIRALRGMQWRDLQRHLPALSECIESALALPEDDLPQRIRRDTTPQVNVLAQFLASALNSISRRAQLAPSLVGTVDDIRELIAHRLGISRAQRDRPPALARGWRSEIVGGQIDDLLTGKLSIRIVNPLSDEPLAFEKPGNSEPK